MQTLFDFSPMVIALVPIAIGLVELLKSMGLPGRYSAIASVVMGIGLSFVNGLSWQSALAQGLMIGMAASGLYSGAKATVATSKVDDHS